MFSKICAGPALRAGCLRQQAIVAHWYENREAVVIGSSVNTVPLGVEDLLAPYRMPHIV